MRWRLHAIVLALSLAGCATAPIGPSVMVLPGAGKPLEQFQADDTGCRQWASQQTAPGGDAWMWQRRYDIAYQQCMYARGNEIPGVGAPRGSSGPPPAPGRRVPAPPAGAVTPPRDAPPPPPPAPPR
jgi:hypothetical protein